MQSFPTISETEIILSEIIDDIPKAFFDELNGGIVLLDQAKLHPDSKPSRPLYIMGEYVIDRLGRQIKIYYGSFKKVHDPISTEQLTELLKKTLIHEFVHHLEGRAGLKGLEIEDAIYLKRYLENQKG